jgi:hypothetical protein
MSALRAVTRAYAGAQFCGLPGGHGICEQIEVAKKSLPAVLANISGPFFAADIPEHSHGTGGVVRVKAAVRGVHLLRHRAEVNPSVVARVSVGVVNRQRRPFSGLHGPDGLMGAQVVAAHHSLAIASRLRRRERFSPGPARVPFSARPARVLRAFSEHSIRALAPKKAPRVRFIPKAFGQLLRGGAAHCRTIAQFNSNTKLAEAMR